jgi:hypothetical protein
VGYEVVLLDLIWKLEPLAVSLPADQEVAEDNIDPQKVGSAASWWHHRMHPGAFSHRFYICSPYRVPRVLTPVFAFTLTIWAFIVIGGVHDPLKTPETSPPL